MTVIVAARGYPGTPASGGLIRKIEAAEQVEGVTVFHAGTAARRFRPCRQRGASSCRHGRRRNVRERQGPRVSRR